LTSETLIFAETTAMKLLFYFGLPLLYFGFFQPPVASIQNVKLCDALNAERNCATHTDTFPATTETFYVSCAVHDAPDSTEVTFAWYYIADEDKELIDKVVLNPLNYTGEKSSVYTLNSNLTRSSPAWPKGSYEVVIVADYDLTQPVSRLFVVE